MRMKLKVQILVRFLVHTEFHGPGASCGTVKFHSSHYEVAGMIDRPEFHCEVDLTGRELHESDDLRPAAAAAAAAQGNQNLSGQLID